VVSAGVAAVPFSLVRLGDVRAVVLSDSRVSVGIALLSRAATDKQIAAIVNAAAAAMGRTVKRRRATSRTPR